MVTALDIRDFLGDRCSSTSGDLSVECTSLAPLSSSRLGLLCFCKSAGALAGASTTGTAVVLVPEVYPALSGVTQVVVDSPRLEFMRCAARFFPKAADWPSGEPVCGSSSVIKEGVVLGPGVTIGADCVVHENVVIKAGATIGDHVVVHANTTIGSDGFGYERDPLSGRLLKFPHVASVRIEDDVEIGSNTCIDRGALTDTVVRRGARIDNLVHIAHNVEVGRDSLVIANAMIGGSVKIGDSAWIAPSATVINGVSIGAGATVGIGALVTKPVGDGQTVAGSPAREIGEFRSLLRAMGRLANGE